MRRRTHLLILLFLISFSTNTLFSQKKRRSDFYGQSNINLLRTNVSRHAIIFSLGATNLFSFDERRAKILDENPNQEYFFTSGGKFGSMAEIGMLHFTKRNNWKFIKIDHYDWAIGIKDFQGWEETRLVTRDDPNLSATGETARGEFSLTYLTARTSFHHLTKLTSRIQLDQSIGINVDYKISGSTPGDNSGYEPFVLASTQSFQKNFLGQIHYELGFRIRAVELLHITPSIQLPILNLIQWSGGRSNINWFSSKYHPYLLRFKIMIPRMKKQGKCPATYSNPDDERRNKEYMEGK